MLKLYETIIYVRQGYNQYSKATIKMDPKMKLHRTQRAHGWFQQLLAYLSARVRLGIKIIIIPFFFFFFSLFLLFLSCFSLFVYTSSPCSLLINCLFLLLSHSIVLWSSELFCCTWDSAQNQFRWWWLWFWLLLLLLLLLLMLVLLLLIAAIPVLLATEPWWEPAWLLW